MANAFYNKVKSTVAEYIGNDKAELAVKRQVDRANTTADAFSSDHLLQVMDSMIGVCTLYLANGEQDKLDAVTEKLKSLV
jgi:hypothetical protein